MSRIHLLPEDVASQVAAGEVVERPASVLKELVENSIDAGATQIEVMIRRGGVALIRVVDNGVGMDRNDALLCLERHATSKIRTGHDLAAIATLGFRGEALPSIASVSRFRLTTRPPEAIAGTEVLVAGGKIEAVRDSGEAPGTQVEVRSLFYNLPARRKFLRSENTEGSHLQHQLHLQAIGHPHIGFVFVNDERIVYQLPPATNLLERIRALCGADLAARLIEVPAGPSGEITISGWIGQAGLARSSRSQQIVFLNGRVVENGTINYALREGYHTALMKGQHPVTFLFIQMDPAAVDVNVHPSKREIRFRDQNTIREAIVDKVRQTLDANRAVWSKNFQPGASAPPVSQPEINPILPAPAPRESPTTPALIPPQEQVALRRDWSQIPVSPPPKAPGAETPSAAPPLAPEQATRDEFKIIGVLGKLYVLMENASGLVLVDQHAAHERVLFEEMRRRLEEQGVPSQRLLIPLTLQLSPKDGDWITQNAGTLQKMGIGLEPWGTNTWRVDSVPQFIQTHEPLQLITDIIDELRIASTQSSKTRLGEDVIATTVCRHAVKANDYLRERELVRLIQDLLRCELPYCCPHGRPTMIQMSYAELEKKFGRRA